MVRSEATTETHCHVHTFQMWHLTCQHVLEALPLTSLWPCEAA